MMMVSFFIFQAVAWMTAAHRFTKNPYDDIATSTDDQGKIKRPGL